MSFDKEVVKHAGLRGVGPRKEPASTRQATSVWFDVGKSRTLTTSFHSSSHSASQPFLTNRMIMVATYVR